MQTVKSDFEIWLEQKLQLRIELSQNYNVNNGSRQICTGKLCHRDILIFLESEVGG